MRKLIPLFLLVLLPAASAAAQNSVLFRGARVFDGSTVLENTDVLVTGSTIAAVGKQLKAPAGAQVIDATGKTLLPGLIDAHTHVFGNALQEAAVFGVTTELDMFTEPDFARSMRAEQQKSGATDRADLFSAGVLVTAPGGHGTEYGFAIPTITAPDAAQAFVDARIAEGSDYIKLVYDDGALFGLKWPTLSAATMKAVIEASHQRNKLAMVHISTLRAAQEALDAGADGLVHLFTDAAADAKFIVTARRKPAFVTPTLVVLKSITGVGGGAPLADDAHLQPYLTLAARTALGRGFPVAPNTPHKNYEFARDAVAQLHKAGVTILAGTDAPNPGTAHGSAMHRELELLVEAGLSPVEALAAATSRPARVFGLQDRGSIAAGKRADLLLVDGDPTKDILATRAIAGVWKAGRAIDRAAFANAVAAAVSAGNAAPGGLSTGAIADFESGTAMALFGSGMMNTTDRMAGGSSSVASKVADDGAANSAKSLEVSGTIETSFAYPWAGVMWSPGSTPMQAADLSSKKEIRFWAKGDGGTYRIMLFAESRGNIPVEQNFVAGPEWREFTFPWSAFGLDGKGIMAIIFTAGGKAGEFRFQIDQVGLQ